MNLNNLKPAWRQFRLLNSMEAMDREEILLIIDQAEAGSISTIHRYLINSFIVALLIVCCQAG